MLTFKWVCEAYYSYFLWIISLLFIGMNFWRYDLWTILTLLEKIWITALRFWIILVLFSLRILILILSVIVNLISLLSLIISFVWKLVLWKMNYWSLMTILLILLLLQLLYRPEIKLRLMLLNLFLIILIKRLQNWKLIKVIVF